MKTISFFAVMLSLVSAQIFVFEPAFNMRSDENLSRFEPEKGAEKIPSFDGVELFWHRSTFFSQLIIRSLHAKKWVRINVVFLNTRATLTVLTSNQNSPTGTREENIADLNGKFYQSWKDPNESFSETWLELNGAFEDVLIHSFQLADSLPVDESHSQINMPKVTSLPASDSAKNGSNGNIPALKDADPSNYPANTHAKKTVSVIKCNGEEDSVCESARNLIDDECYADFMRLMNGTNWISETNLLFIIEKDCPLFLQFLVDERKIDLSPRIANYALARKKYSCLEVLVNHGIIPTSEAIQVFLKTADDINKSRLRLAGIEW